MLNWLFKPVLRIETTAKAEPRFESARKWFIFSYCFSLFVAIAGPLLVFVFPSSMGESLGHFVPLFLAASLGLLGLAAATLLRYSASKIGVLLGDVQQSKTDLRHLIQLSSDRYWRCERRVSLLRGGDGSDLDQDFAKRLMGCSIPWVHGNQSVVDRLELLDPSLSWSQFSDLLVARQTFERVLCQCWLQGSIRHVFEVTGQPLFDDKNRFIGYEGVSRDITESWLNERLSAIQRRFLQGAILCVPLPEIINAYARGLRQSLLVHTELLMGYRANRSERHWTIQGGSRGFRLDSVYGWSFWDNAEQVLIPITGEPVDSSLIRVGVLPEDYIPDDWKTDHQIESVWVQMKEAESPNEPEYWVAVLQKQIDEVQHQDVARVLTALKLLGVCVERRVYEQRMTQLNHSLEERVEQRTAALNESNEDLKAFAYTVSHDLRAPLRAINGFSGILKEDYLEDLPEDARDLLDRIVTNVSQMSDLIDGLLHFSRQLSTEVKRETVNMHSLVEEVLQRLDARSRAKVELDELPVIQVDPMLLQQVWQNLIDNALKFTSKVASPRIRIACHKLPDGYEFSVSDNGQGFDMRYADRLFKVFERLHHRRDYEGTGVGLAIVKQIIERHGGKISAESAPEKGASFTFTILNG